MSWIWIVFQSTHGMSSTASSGMPPTQTAHPHQLGVQDFGSYALVIDTRSEPDFFEDHVPGAASAPLVRGSVSLDTGQWLERLSPLLSSVLPGNTLLAYGDADNEPFLNAVLALRERGFRVDVIAGGWANYRRWVSASLEVLPRAFDIHVLRAGPATGVELVVDALCELGEQVVDAGEQVDRSRCPGMDLARERPMSQAAFETWLVHSFRHRETDRRLWFVEPLPGASVRLPAALQEVIHAAPVLVVNVDPEERRRAWLARLHDAQHELPTVTPTLADLEPAAPGASGVLKLASLDEVSVKNAVQRLLAGLQSPHSSP